MMLQRGPDTYDFHLLGVFFSARSLNGISTKRPRLLSRKADTENRIPKTSAHGHGKEK
jgi:hypothetical protein